MNTTANIADSAEIETTLAKGTLIARLFETSDTLSPIALRLALAVTMFPHGAQKLLGWWGGFGFDATMGYFTGSHGIPWIFAFGVVLLEFFGPILLVLGVGTRFAALGLGAVMTGAIFTEQIQHGFFMNWFGNQAGEGIEYSLLVLGIAISLVMSGAGRYSSDRFIAKRLSSK